MQSHSPMPLKWPIVQLISLQTSFTFCPRPLYHLTPSSTVLHTRPFVLSSVHLISSILYFLSLLYSQWYPLGLNLKKRALVLSLDSARSADQHSHLLTLFWIARVWSVLLLHRWKTCDTHTRARTAVTLKGQLKIKLNERVASQTRKRDYKSFFWLMLKSNPACCCVPETEICRFSIDPNFNLILNLHKIQWCIKIEKSVQMLVLQGLC